MAQYASKTPRDLNHDTEPWLKVRGETVIRRERNRMAVLAWGERFTYEPRPEYDHPQHNLPNPILVAVREEMAGRPEGLSGRVPYQAGYRPDRSGYLRAYRPTWVEHYLSFLESETNTYGWSVGFGLSQTPTRAQRDHARRVLTRLARLAEMKEDA